eukprot:4554341-Pyramimonas_sp.AAC.1
MPLLVPRGFGWIRFEISSERTTGKVRGVAASASAFRFPQEAEGRREAGGRNEERGEMQDRNREDGGRAWRGGGLKEEGKGRRRHRVDEGGGWAEGWRHRVDGGEEDE